MSNTSLFSITINTNRTKQNVDDIPLFVKASHNLLAKHPLKFLTYRNDLNDGKINDDITSITSYVQDKVEQGGVQLRVHIHALVEVKHNTSLKVDNTVISNYMSNVLGFKVLTKTVHNQSLERGLNYLEKDGNTVSTYHVK